MLQYVGKVDLPLQCRKISFCSLAVQTTTLVALLFVQRVNAVLHWPGSLSHSHANLESVTKLANVILSYHSGIRYAPMWQIIHTPKLFVNLLVWGFLNECKYCKKMFLKLSCLARGPLFRSRSYISDSIPKLCALDPIGNKIVNSNKILDTNPANLIACNQRNSLISIVK